MKVTGVSMVRNEADVIEAFVRHNVEAVDELVVVDHASVDGTAGILAALAAEGLPLDVRTERSPVHRQNVVMTALMREAATVGGADWVVPLDADEFLVAGSAGVRQALASLPSERPRVIDMRFYVPTPDDPPDEPNVLRRLRYRRALDCDTWTRKVLVPGAWARNDRFKLVQGSHGLVTARGRRFAAAPFTDELALAHFPVRSADQIARKVLAGWPAWLARPDRARSGNFQWKRVFEAITDGRPLTARQLQTIAEDYPTRKPDGRPELIMDPVSARFELRYDVPRGPAPLEVLAGTTVRLAEELSGVLRGPAAHATGGRPVVSVVIPTYNRRRRAERAVKSVLAQTLPNFELIVVDDGSDDGTRESLAGLDERLRYHRQENRGPSAARNAGIRLARAPVVAFLDADNRWLPDHLETVVAVLARHPAAVLASTCPEFEVAGDERPDHARLIDLLPASLLWNRLGYVSGIAVRRDALLDVGGFDERMSAGEDDDLALRLALEGPFAMLRRRTIVRRYTRGGLRDRGRRSGAYTEANTLSLTRALERLERRSGPQREELLVRARARLHLLAAVAALERGDDRATRMELAQACRLVPELKRNPGFVLAQVWKSTHDRGELRRRAEAAAAAMPDPACQTALYLRGYAATMALIRGRLRKALRLLLSRPHLLRRGFIAGAYRPAVRLARRRVAEIARSKLG